MFFKFILSFLIMLPGMTWAEGIISDSGIMANDGAISGGGGGTTNPEPIDMYRLNQTIVNEAPLRIDAWLKGVEGTFEWALTEQEQTSSIYRVLFRNEKNIFDVTKNLEIFIAKDKPCYDAARGYPHDGSSFAPRPGTICISTYSLAPKLNIFNYQEETAALILHEITHLMGATESEAQNFARNRAPRISPDQSVHL